MRTYKALCYFEVDALDKGEAEKEALKELKKKKLKATLVKIEEG